MRPRVAGSFRNAGASDLVVVASRLPVSWTLPPVGAGRWEEAPGGLATALRAVLTRRNATWVGVGCSGLLDGQAASLPAVVGSTRLDAVQLSERDHRHYYEGACNAHLWPWMHDMEPKTDMGVVDWDTYRRVNATFAARAAHAAGCGSTVWVHDYQLMLVPQMLRSLRPDLRIGFFLHTPFPSRPNAAHGLWQREMFHGLLGADLIGLQTRRDAETFLTAAAPHFAVIDRKVRVATFPVSVDTASLRQAALDPATRGRAGKLRSVLCHDRSMFLGIDRLDYTKGIPTRLRAFRELLTEGQIRSDEAHFLQVAAPSRPGIVGYTEVEAAVQKEVDLLRAHRTGDNPRVITYVQEALRRDRLIPLYLAADVLCVTSHRDGMNLVAKEFVAVKHDSGALVLSTGAGAAEELTSAWQVDPDHVEDVKRGMLAALRSGPGERRARMTAMSDQLLHDDVHTWADRFLDALEGSHD